MRIAKSKYIVLISEIKNSVTKYPIVRRKDKKAITQSMFYE